MYEKSFLWNQVPFHEKTDECLKGSDRIEMWCDSNMPIAFESSAISKSLASVNSSLFTIAARSRRVLKTYSCLSSYGVRTNPKWMSKRKSHICNSTTFHWFEKWEKTSFRNWIGIKMQIELKNDVSAGQKTKDQVVYWIRTLPTKKWLTKKRN